MDEVNSLVTFIISVFFSICRNKFCLFVLFFRDRACLCNSPSCPGTQAIDQTASQVLGLRTFTATETIFMEDVTCTLQRVSV